MTGETFPVNDENMNLVNDAVADADVAKVEAVNAAIEKNETKGKFILPKETLKRFAATTVALTTVMTLGSACGKKDKNTKGSPTDTSATPATESVVSGAVEAPSYLSDVPAETNDSTMITTRDISAPLTTETTAESTTESYVPATVLEAPEHWVEWGQQYEIRSDEVRVEMGSFDYRNFRTEKDYNMPGGGLNLNACLEYYNIDSSKLKANSSDVTLGDPNKDKVAIMITNNCILYYVDGQVKYAYIGTSTKTLKEDGVMLTYKKADGNMATSISLHAQDIDNAFDVMLSAYAKGQTTSPFKTN